MGLDFELGVFVRALMLKVWNKNDVPGPYDLNELFKQREEGAVKALPVKECSFGKGLTKYLGCSCQPARRLFVHSSGKLVQPCRRVWISAGALQCYILR